MKILVTGAKGFVGKNLCAQLNALKEGKDHRFPDLAVDEVFEYDIDSTPEELDRYCAEADFVFNLAGVNRPENPEDFKKVISGSPLNFSTRSKSTATVVR